MKDDCLVKLEALMNFQGKYIRLSPDDDKKKKERNATYAWRIKPEE
jgi:hypothetical protein